MIMIQAILFYFIENSLSIDITNDCI